MTSSTFHKFRVGRFRQAADADILVPPPLPLIKLPDEVRRARSGACDGRPMHLPVRRHLHPEHRNQPAEPTLVESHTMLEAEAQERQSKEITNRYHIYEYSQPDLYELSGAPADTLVFDSRFEGGNLHRAERIIREDAATNATNKRSTTSHTRQEYELLIHPDIHNSAYRQWFYFQVENGQPGVVYTFTFLNLAKSGALFGFGLQPVVYSEKQATIHERGWHHAGTHVRYESASSLMADGNANILTFQYEFTYANDQVFFACLPPYSYTELMEYIERLEGDPIRSAYVRRTELCQTIAQNTCDLLTITAKDSVLTAEEKKVIVISARVHPGESNSSWMMKGMLDYLTGSSTGAAALRQHLIFKIVPMLNPDGVINGNTRVNLAGWDLNRKWLNPIEKLFPTIYHLKRLIATLQTRDRVALYCDLHGHSIHRSIFMYGCHQKTSSRSNDPRVFPMIVAKHSDFFSFAHCDFKVSKSKLHTARVVVHQELGVINSYTLEASFCGPDFGPRRHTQFSCWDLEEMGKTWCQSLLIYFGLLPIVRELDRQAQEGAVVPSATELIEAEGITPRLSTEAQLLEMTGDLLTDCEAALSEFLANGHEGFEEVVVPGQDGSGQHSCGADLSDAEEAIPPNHTPEQDDDMIELPQEDGQAAYMSAPEGTTTTFKRMRKLKRRLTSRRKPRVDDGVVACGEGGEDVDLCVKNGEEQLQKKEKKEKKKKKKGRDKHKRKEDEGDDEVGDGKRIKRNKSRRKAKKSSSCADLSKVVIKPIRPSIQPLVLPEMPKTQHKAHRPLGSARTPRSIVEEPRTTENGSNSARSVGMLERIGSGAPLELPPVHKPFSPLPQQDDSSESEDSSCGPESMSSDD